jgi:prophage DNA circulation protein
MSGILGQITRTISGVTGVVSATGALVNDVARIGQSGQAAGASLGFDTSGLSFGSGAWFQQLQPGSWRGVGFVLDAGETAAGRRVALHEYPYRDDVWAEDLGKLPRRFSVQGFAVGDDCYQQRDAMLRAAEQAGAGTLVHPTLGSVQCVLLEFATADRRERGRVVEFQFSFVVAGDVMFPAAALATTQNVLGAAAKLTTASASDLGSTLQRIGNVAKSVYSTVTHYASIATGIVGDASRVFNAVRGLVGFHGRYATGSRSTLQPVTATVQGLLGAATTARTLVNTSASLVTRLASFL